MNYYLRLQQHSEGHAARVFEELYAAASERRSIAVLLAAALERAGVITTAWAITLDPDNVRVNVGPVRLLSLSRSRIWFCTTGSRLAVSPKWLRDVSRGGLGRDQQ
jgi:hypothetical protein